MCMGGSIVWKRGQRVRGGIGCAEKGYHVGTGTSSAGWVENRKCYAVVHIRSPIGRTGYRHLKCENQCACVEVQRRHVRIYVIDEFSGEISRDGGVKK
jgi:hypothetical protein